MSPVHLPLKINIESHIQELDIKAASFRHKPTLLPPFPQNRHFTPVQFEEYSIRTVLTYTCINNAKDDDARERLLSEITSFLRAIQLNEGASVIYSVVMVCK